MHLTSSRGFDGTLGTDLSRGQVFYDNGTPGGMEIIR